MQNPFYEVVVDANLGTIRMTPEKAYECVIPIGTPLLLRTSSDEFQAIVRNMTGRGRNFLTHKRKRCTRVKIKYDQRGVPTRPLHIVANHNSTGLSRERQPPLEEEDEAEEPLAGGDENVGETFLLVRLDISRSFVSTPGLVYVTIETRSAKNISTVDTRGIFVKPFDLFRNPPSMSVRGGGGAAAAAAYAAGSWDPAVAAAGNMEGVLPYLVI